MLEKGRKIRIEGYKLPSMYRIKPIAFIAYIADI